MEYGACDGDHAEMEILKKVTKISYRPNSNKLKSIVDAITLLYKEWESKQKRSERNFYC